MRAVRNVLLLTALLALCSCASSAVATTQGPGSPSPSASGLRVTHVDPCALVTAADASAAAGKTLVNLVSLGGPPITGACIYDARDNSSAVFVYAQVYPDAATADAVTPEQLESATASMITNGGPEIRDVKGIGDKAAEFSYKRVGSGLAIVVYRANVVFLIAADPISGPATVDGLARTALTRL